MKVLLKAKSSSSGPYDVTIEFSHGVLSARCSCKAGVMNTLCKHRVALLQGDESMLFDPGQVADLQNVLSWVQQTDFPLLFERLADAEKDVAEAQKAVKQQKKEIQKSMSGGLGSVLQREARK